ncbi:uncharacterized protein STEHIDRAFT_122304, partial [Stereum hirsutum FP-91666 SS1]|uniref:uncharacterized protein n=1 Tax=Stereum hirsutum (strain FP-91666) TaxID=721885 RepID=UPI00044492A1
MLVQGHLFFLSLRELLALVAVVLTTINVFATTSTTSGRRVRIRTYVESPLTAQPKTVCVVPSDADADTTNIWTSADSLRLQRVAMTPEESVHYNLDTNAGGVEWVSVLPHGRGVVFLNSSSTSSSSDPSSHSSVSARNGNGKAPYRVAMFHQLDCLNVLREEMVLLQHTRTRTSTHSHTASESQDRAQFCL